MMLQNCILEQKPKYRNICLILWYKNEIFSKQSIPCFLYNCGDKHHMLYCIWKIQYHEMQVNENLSLKAGDKAETWIKGLKKLRNNFILPDRAAKSFHSTISMCPWQYLGEILSSCVYIYRTFQFVYQRWKFHPRPHTSGHCFQITANFSH